METAEKYLDKLKKRLEKELARLGTHPDRPEFWKKHTLGKIEGLDTSRAIYIRTSTLEECGLPPELICLKGWLYAPNREIYQKCKKDGYELIGLHPKSKTPCLFKATAEKPRGLFSGSERRARDDFFPPPSRDDWFLPPDK